MLKTLQESINTYIQKEKIAETLQKEIIFKTICKSIKKIKQNQINSIIIKTKTIFIKTTSSEIKQEILLNKKNILQQLKKKSINYIDIK